MGYLSLKARNCFITKEHPSKGWKTSQILAAFKPVMPTKRGQFGNYLAGCPDGAADGAALGAAEGAPLGTGEATGAAAVAWPSKTLFLPLLETIVRVTEVIMKIPARVVVRRVKKLAPPELPNTVWLDPPKLALISAPFPDWIRTTRMMRTQVMTWTVVTRVCIDVS